MRWGLVIMLLLLAACAGEENMENHRQQAETATPLVETTGTISIEKEIDGGGNMAFTRERVTFTSKDGTPLVANYYAGESKGILLLHQFKHDKESWDAFAKELQQQGYSVLALDLRGHGESGGNLDAFSEKDFQAMLEDAEAGATFLGKKGPDLAFIMGASIGANTAYRFSSRNRVPAVLLSPGLDYKGIDINNITSTSRTLIVVSEGDTYSADSSREIEENNLFGEHELKVIPGEKHGTYLLEEPGVKETILSFIG